jgi:Zn-dependent M16 (insulinase) family peptidase
MLDLGEVQEYLMIGSACLDKNILAMYDLLRQFVTETNWDNEKKLDSLIKNSASGVVNSIANAGSKFARLYASSKLTPAKVRLPSTNFNLQAADEVMGGLSQIRLLCQMARWSEYKEVIAKLKVCPSPRIDLMIRKSHPSF